MGAFQVTNHFTKNAVIKQQILNANSDGIREIDGF